MKLSGNENNSATLTELGQRVRDQRIAADMTQVQLAKKSGVSPQTIARLESGESIALQGFLSVLRALRLLQNVELLIPEYRMMPTDVFDGQKKRVRARHKQPSEVVPEWTWGDEA